MPGRWRCWWSTPGPVVAALIARAATGGVRAAVPLAAGVAVGDVVWPLAGDARDRGGRGGLGGLPDGAALRRARRCWSGWGCGWCGKAEAAALRVTGGRPGREPAWAGFAAGLMVIAGNPKAILFYMGVLPGFFDFRTLTPLDMARDLPRLGAGAVPRQPRLGGAVRPGPALAGRPGGDAADPRRRRPGAGRGGGGDCGGVSAGGSGQVTC